MIYVPTGYIAPHLFKIEANGGSAWGASTIAGGDGSRQPSAEELEFATVSLKCNLELTPFLTLCIDPR